MQGTDITVQELHPFLLAHACGLGLHVIYIVHTTIRARMANKR